MRDKIKTGIDRRHRSLLHHHQEQTDHARQDGNQKFDPVARKHVISQGNQAEVIQPRLPMLLKAPMHCVRGFCFLPRNLLLRRNAATMPPLTGE